MTPPIVVERGENLVVVVRFLRAATDSEFAQYLRDYTQVLETTPRFGAVFVTPEGLPMTPGRQVRMQARFMKDYAARIAERVVGVAFSLPTPLMRGVLRGVLLLQAMPCPHAVVATEPEGVAWVRARLWTDHVRRMKSPGP